MLLARSARCAAPRGSAPFRSALAPARPVVIARGKAAEAEIKDKKGAKAHEEEDEFEDGPDVLPSTQQVESLINVLCNDTEIAELNLKMGGFSLRVKRSMTGHTQAHAPVQAAAPAPAPVVHEVPVLPELTAEDTIDESLVSVFSPKVGIFRRGKYAGGKRIGKGSLVNEGDKVKKGQVIGYIEQLGTHFPVEASIAGEVLKFEVDEGRAVEYGQLVTEIAPYFGGHIIGDKKHI